MEDYQFYKSVLAWDESSIFAHWRNRSKSFPFSILVSHMNQILGFDDPKQMVGKVFWRHALLLENCASYNIRDMIHVFE